MSVLSRWSWLSCGACLVWCLMVHGSTARAVSLGVVGVSVPGWVLDPDPPTGARFTTSSVFVIRVLRPRTFTLAESIRVDGRLIGVPDRGSDYTGVAAPSRVTMHIDLDDTTSVGCINNSVCGIIPAGIPHIIRASDQIASVRCAPELADDDATGTFLVVCKRRTSANELPFVPLSRLDASSPAALWPGGKLVPSACVLLSEVLVHEGPCDPFSLVGMPQGQFGCVDRGTLVLGLQNGTEVQLCRADPSAPLTVARFGHCANQDAPFLRVSRDFVMEFVFAPTSDSTGRVLVAPDTHLYVDTDLGPTPTGIYGLIAFTSNPIARDGCTHRVVGWVHHPSQWVAAIYIDAANRMATSGDEPTRVVAIMYRPSDGVA
jgi:hypothetical protein